MKRDPRCPDCGWTLEFYVIIGGAWAAHCGNRACRRNREMPGTGYVDSSEAVWRP